MALEFGSQMKAWCDKTGDDLDTVVVQTVADLSRKVIKRTPVGDPTYWQSPPPKGYIGGTARGNWFASLGAPITAPNKNARDENGSSTLSAAIKVAQQAPGNVFYLTNNVPYIMRLEYGGWSRQAPAGMVRVSMAEIDQAIKKAIASLK
jgi:hypothetical protein